MEVLEVNVATPGLTTSSNNTDDGFTISDGALKALGSLGVCSGIIGLFVHLYIAFCYLYERTESFTASQSLIVSLSVFDAFLMFNFILISLGLTGIFSGSALVTHVIENAYFVTFHILVYLLSLYLAVNRYCILLAPVRTYLALFSRKTTQKFFIVLSFTTIALITLLVTLRLDVVDKCTWKQITAILGGLVGGLCLPVMATMYCLITGMDFFDPTNRSFLSLWISL